MKTQITVYEGALTYFYNFTGFVAWTQEMLDKIPEEYRGEAVVDFSTDLMYYGDDIGYPTIEIRYYRKETPEEQDMRLFKIQENELLAQERELELLKQLKGKYE